MARPRADEEISEMKALLELFQQVDDLSLDGDVQGGDGLVAHEEIRLESQSAGDANALALAAGELMGVAVGEDRVAHDQAQRLFRLLLSLFAPGDPVDLHGLGDDLAHDHSWVQGGVGILEDEQHLSVPVRRSLPVVTSTQRAIR